MTTPKVIEICTVDLIAPHTRESLTSLASEAVGQTEPGAYMIRVSEGVATIHAMLSDRGWAPRGEVCVCLSFDALIDELCNLADAE